MIANHVGFIGAGRVTRIILGGLKKAGHMPVEVIASDTNPDVLKQLQSGFPEVRTVLNDNRLAAVQDVVFLGLHPPALPGALAEIKDRLNPAAIVISLAPKMPIARIAEGLAGFDRIVRVIPNAAAIIGEGYNPISFSKGFTQQEKEDIHSFLRLLGKCPEVAEDKLEAYAIVTAMGPTYFWFQWKELQCLGESFGMSTVEAETGIFEMMIGAAKTLFSSGMLPEEVIDLIPVKPLGEEETSIRAMYKGRLEPLFRKLKG